MFVFEEHAERREFIAQRIPLLREPRGYFPTSDTDPDSEEPTVFQDATVFSFNTKRESTEHGGGKTSEETIKNIRMRHASGTFCTLVYPTMTWPDVVKKFNAVLPHVRELHGELRSRRFMGIVRNSHVEILLQN
ncbi:hypothetical protein P43SY_008569 [Pythium insidiosum]|uniref:Uncharacterized protein n=1 Tax=Pythium insidiosum TaxID=114742 RepID=A0AAD5M2R9_PYTIN|nr:hypothetical protein P43SY_008569 [Pythium insidiosum]